MDDILDRNVVPRGDVVASRVGNETVLLHLTNAIYFGLNETGTLLWDALKQKRQPRQVCAQIAENYQVELVIVEEDIRQILGELKVQNLVEVS